MSRSLARTLGTAWTKGRSFRRNEDGSVLAYIVVVPVLAGALAIGVETGELYRVKRQMQSAADDAALAGAIDRVADATTSTIALAARHEAQRSGFTEGADGVSVTVNVPPTSGPDVSTAGAVEVIIRKTQNLAFGAVLNSWMGRTSNGYTLTSRAVAVQTTTLSAQTGTSTPSTISSVACTVALTSNSEQGVSISSTNTPATARPCRTAPSVH